MKQKNAVYTEVGIDYAIFALNAGYARRIGNWTILGEFTQTLPEPGLKNFRATLSAQYNVKAGGRWLLPLRVGVKVANDDNPLSQITGLGFTVNLMPGYYASRFALASELAFDRIQAAYFVHSDRYRQNYFPEAKDGWYSSTATHWRLGLRTAYLFNRTELIVRGGYQAGGEYDKFVPRFYALLGVSYRF